MCLSLLTLTLAWNDETLIQSQALFTAGLFSVVRSLNDDTVDDTDDTAPIAGSASWRWTVAARSRRQPSTLRDNQKSAVLICLCCVHVCVVLSMRDEEEKKEANAAFGMFLAVKPQQVTRSWPRSSSLQFYAPDHRHSTDDKASDGCCSRGDEAGGALEPLLRRVLTVGTRSDERPRVSGGYLSGDLLQKDLAR